MAKVHARGGLWLHHVFCLERLMMALMLDVSIGLYLSST